MGRRPLQPRSLRGRLAAESDPHGLRLRGACIAGQLDLENLTTRVGVELDDCLLGEGLVVRDAKLAATSYARESYMEPPR